MIFKYTWKLYQCYSIKGLNLIFKFPETDVYMPQNSLNKLLSISWKLVHTYPMFRPKFAAMVGISELKTTAAQVRRDIVRMVYDVQSGHPGGSLGCADFLTALFLDIMKYQVSPFSKDGNSLLQRVGTQWVFPSSRIGDLSQIEYPLTRTSCYPWSPARY